MRLNSSPLSFQTFSWAIFCTWNIKHIQHVCWSSGDEFCILLFGCLQCYYPTNSTDFENQLCEKAKKLLSWNNLHFYLWAATVSDSFHVISKALGQCLKFIRNIAESSWGTHIVKLDGSLVLLITVCWENWPCSDIHNESIKQTTTLIRKLHLETARKQKFVEKKAPYLNIYVGSDNLNESFIFWYHCPFSKVI